MIRDIKLLLKSNENNKINYIYSINKGIIKCFFNNENNRNILLLFDENIFDIKISNIKYKKIFNYKIELLIDKDNQDLSFDVVVNYKFLVRTIFDYINDHIEYDELLSELKLFRETNNKYKDELDLLIDEISKSNGSIANFMNNCNILLNNKLYLEFTKKMNNKDIMLLITNYIRSDKIPHVDQELFNDIVKEAIKSENNLENTWRLAMNYDGLNYNYDLIDDFFVNSKNSWYLEEYLSGVEQVSDIKITNMLLEMNDKEFIKEFLDEYNVKENLSDKCLTLLEKAIRN